MSLQDYPSIAHLVQKLSDHNIQTIFAITEEFQPVYKVSVRAGARPSPVSPPHPRPSSCPFQELKNLIPKSAVGTLSSNSSNVIKLIIDAYNVSRTSVSLRPGHHVHVCLTCPVCLCTVSVF